MAQSFLQRMMRAISFCNPELRKQKRSDAVRLRRFALEHLESRQLLAVITVTSLLDNINASDGLTTLREAVATANATPAVADAIQFAVSGVVNLSNVGDGGMGASALLIASPITIQGNASGITLRRDAASIELRLFRVTTTGNLTLESLTLAGGVARGAAGTIGTPNGGDGRGGAIFNQGTLLIRGSTLFDHRAVGGDAYNVSSVGGAALGGAIWNDGGSATIVNATFSGNATVGGIGSPTNARFAAGIYSRNGTLSIYNSTLTDNNAAVGRGVYVLGDGTTATATVHSSIIGQDDAVFASEFAAIAGDAPGGAIVVNGANNLIRAYVGADSNFATKSAPLLVPLANNGGPTQTHAFQAESWAGDHGSNLQNLSNDQRGGAFGRVKNGNADIGAYEYQTTSGGSVAGDYNGNQTVDAADYVVWRNTLGTFVAASTGADGDGSSQIDAGDYTVWNASFGKSTSSVGAATVLEYASISAPESSATPITHANLPTQRVETGALLTDTTPRNDQRHGNLFGSNGPINPRAHDLALLDLVATERGHSNASVGEVLLEEQVRQNLWRTSGFATDSENIELWGEWWPKLETF